MNARSSSLCSPALLLMASRTEAHGAVPAGPEQFWYTWNLKPSAIGLLVFAAALYGLGLHRLWSRAGTGHGIARHQAICYGIGIAVLGVALLSPLDPMGEVLSSAHMLQHMLLLFAAPLLVIASPLPVYLWALPRSWRGNLQRQSTRSWVASPWRFVTGALTAWLIYTATLWAWHAPGLYQAAIDSPLIHDLEHLSFLAAALLFWWAVFRNANRAVSLVLLFTAMIHSGLLAALMTFTSKPWYPVYENSTRAWGLSPLEDQQLAGLLMWVPGSLLHLVAGLALLGFWLQRLESGSAVAAPRRAGA